MTVAKWRVCNVSGCPELTTTAKCEAHTRQRDADQRHRKGSAYQTAGHRAFRTLVLHRDPICVVCHITIATEADHHPKDRDQLILEGLDPNNPEFGRGLCKSCHSRSTAIEQPGWST